MINERLEFELRNYYSKCYWIGCIPKTPILNDFLIYMLYMVADIKWINSINS